MITNGRRRALHIIDIENLLGTPRPSVADVEACYQAYCPMIGEHDLVVVACNHGAFAAVAWGWPGARRLVRSGENGADQALIEVLAWERVDRRFAEVALASGDGIFADIAARLGGLGVTVTVVSRPEALSRRLRMAARHVLSLAPAAASWSLAGEPA